MNESFLKSLLMIEFSLFKDDTLLVTDVSLDIGLGLTSNFKRNLIK